MYLYYKFNFMVLLFSRINQNNTVFNQQKNQKIVNKPENQIPNINQNRNFAVLKSPSFNMYDIMNHNKTNCASCGK
jgi:hypothetical protein